MVEIKFKSGKTFEVGNPIKTFRGITLDLSKALEWENNQILSAEGELARLIFEQMNHASYIRGKDINGNDIIIPEKTDGIDFTTATDDELINYKKGSKFTQHLIKRMLSPRQNSTQYLGEVGFSTSHRIIKEEI